MATCTVDPVTPVCSFAELPGHFVSYNQLCLDLLSLAVVTVKTTSSAPSLMVPVLPASPAGMVHDVTAPACPVIMVTAVRRSVHVAETMSPVTQKLGSV